MRPDTIAVAQTPSIAGNVSANIEIHVEAIHSAAAEGVSLLVFPELSLTGYEPELAAELVFTTDDSRLWPLTDAARQSGMTVVVGAPLSTDELPRIGALVISPDGHVVAYAKMHLHPGEEQYFSAGDTYCLLTLNRNRIALAICADANVTSHARACATHGANVYAASAMITDKGYAADTAQLMRHARAHNILVAMANHNCPTGGWPAVGKSAIWNAEGLLAAANETQSALVIADLADGGSHGRVVGL